MYLTALSQRERLFEISMRWLKGHVEPADGAFLKQAFLIEPFITAPVLTGFLREVAAPDATSTRVEHLRTKDDVRQRIARGWSRPTARGRELFSVYRESPEQFFPTTPVDLFAITAGISGLAAMIRFKNLGRIADKVSRKAIARFEGEIHARAEAIDRDSPHLPGAALVDAERSVCQDLADGVLSFTRTDLRLDDLIGAKLIGDPHELERLEARVLAHPGVLSVKRFEHRGLYADTKLQIELACPSTGHTLDRLLANEWGNAQARGLDPGELRRAIPAYVESGEPTFFVEVILTTWEELVESEFGRGLHEERTARQRADARWAQQLSTNVALTMMFLLLVAIAPSADVRSAPTKVSGRYLPETMAAMVSQLFQLEIDRSPLWIPEPDDRAPAPDGWRGGDTGAVSAAKGRV